MSSMGTVVPSSCSLPRFVDCCKNGHWRIHDVEALHIRFRVQGNCSAVADQAIDCLSTSGSHTVDRQLPHSVREEKARLADHLHKEPVKDRRVPRRFRSEAASEGSSPGVSSFAQPAHNLFKSLGVHLHTKHSCLVCSCSCA